jgi:parallel beta-helix repeat protein
MSGSSTGGRRSSARQVRHRFLLMLLPLAALTLPLCGWAQGTTINVRDKGAKGDGVHDDTAAFQAAIDALPSSGGTVTVPSGNYLIDATRAINLRSNMLLQMAPTAQLTASPNSLQRYHVIKVWHADNVRITGGRIVGERSGHLGSGGEWGYGLNIEASNHVSVSDLHISDCWGDGVWIGAIGPDGNATPATDVTLTRVVSTNNRRQGLSIGPVNGVKIVDSTFNGSNGTKPESGIDIEPQAQGMARNISITGCTIADNHGTGMEIHDNVANVVVKNCTIQGNAGYGVMTAGDPSQITITGNTITGNGLIGVTIAGNTNGAQVTGNTLTGNSTRYFHLVLSALSSRSSSEQNHELRVDDTTHGVTVSGNKLP